MKNIFIYFSTNIHIYIYTFILLYLSSCGLEEFHFARLKPESTYEYHPDSIKINQSFNLNLNLGEDQKTIYLIPSYNMQSCSLSADNRLLSSGEKIIFDSNRIVIEPHQIGQIQYTLTFEDIYSNSDTLALQFVCFDNLPPVSILEVTKTGQLSDYQVIIDASKSFDKDFNYGGKILQYKYQINEFYSLTTYHDKINQILPGKGSYVISCQVLDNDNEWSDPVFVDINF